MLGAQSAIAAVDPRMEQQAALLGDRPLRAVRRVTLPLAAPGLAMALAVAWARAMGAFGAVIIIAYHPYGLPLQIWTTLQETGLASALPFALVLPVAALPLPVAATCGAPVLEADVEVDRRDFTVAVALQVAPGERLALFGPSGAGKTTALEVIAGLVPPRRGRVVLAAGCSPRPRRRARAVPPWQRRVGLLRQDPGAVPHLTVRQNLEYGAGPRPDQARTERLAAELGIDGLLAAGPPRLSGGQAHRVALGRLLLARCETLLLDEPYTGLDTGPAGGR